MISALVITSYRFPCIKMGSAGQVSPDYCHHLPMCGNKANVW